MNEYHKINSIYKRDMTKPNNPFIIGEFAEPEIAYLQNNQWEWTEKIDGTNIRVMYVGGEVKFGGKTDKADIPKHLLAKLNLLFPAEKLAAVFGETDACLYGEGFGYKIQSGGNYIQNDVDFYLFDVKVGNWWLKRDDVAGIAEKIGTNPPVVICHGTIHEAIKYVKRGFKSQFGTADAEGLVLRPAVELMSRSGARIITKVKCRDFQ